MTIIRESPKADNHLRIFHIVSGRHRGRPSQEQEVTSSPPIYIHACPANRRSCKKIGRYGCATAYGFKAINYLSLADRQEVYALDDFLAFIAEAEVDKLLSDWAKWLALVGQVVERAG